MFPAPHCHLQSPGRVPFLPPGEAGTSGLRADSRPSGTCSLSPLQIVLENSSREDKHECPFGRSSIELTRMLCDILKVGELRKYPRPAGGRAPGGGGRGVLGCASAPRADSCARASRGPARLGFLCGRPRVSALGVNIVTTCESGKTGRYCD